MNKFEIRNTKYETNPKSEIKNSKLFWTSCFGFVSNFEFRISNF